MNTDAYSSRVLSLLFLSNKQRFFRPVICLTTTLLLSVVLLYWVTSVQAVVVCHDYTLYRVTCENNRCEDNNDTPPTELRRRLGELGYKSFPISTTAENPELAGLVLKPGDVLIIGGGAHSGYVNADYTIDHFIQVQGEVGKPRGVSNLPRYPLSDGRLGGLYLGDTVAQFFSRVSNKEILKSVEVLRRTQVKKSQTLDLSGTWEVTVTDPQVSEKFRWVMGKSSFSSSAMWGIKRTLLSTSNPAKEYIIGQTSDGPWIEFKSDTKVFEYGSNKRPIYESATCAFSENSFSCQGTRQDYSHATRTITTEFKIQGTRTGSPSVSRPNTGAGENRPTNNRVDNNTNRMTQYTSEQINLMRQWIAYYDNLINQWTQYRDQQVAPYWNDRTYRQWARNEYQKCNQQIQAAQQYKAYYQNLLRQAGVR